jgi:nitrogen fixation protein FixH
MRLTKAFARFAEPWPFLVAALLAAMIGTSMGFYRIATRFPDPVVSGDTFQAGLAYADAARAAARARAAGWSLEVETRPTGGGVQVDAARRDATGKRLAADAVTITRARPAEAGFDAAFEQQAGAAQEVPLPRSGRWELHVVARRGDARLEERIPVWMP